MKIQTLLISLLTLSAGLALSKNQSVHSAATIIRCKGQIPNRTACLIKPSSYKINTYRVDICKESPFPSYRSSANFSGAGCMTLFNGNGDLYKGQFAKNSKYKLPKIGKENIKLGKYKYLTMVLKNSFTSSGKYTSGQTTWRTAGTNKKGIPIITKKAGAPVETTVKLTNWRGSNNQNNDYCKNDGGSFSRCEINYNGYELTGIGINSDFIETYGKNITYMFYIVELSSPITLQKDSEGYFEININNDLEVFGNGQEVQSISTPPFIFKATYKKKIQSDK